MISFVENKEIILHNYILCVIGWDLTATLSLFIFKSTYLTNHDVVLVLKF